MFKFIKWTLLAIIVFFLYSACIVSGMCSRWEEENENEQKNS